MTDALRVEAISASRGGRRVINSLSFELGRGEIVAIIGPNGAGKTSLLEAILGFLPGGGGTVFFHGRPMRTLRERARVFSFLSEDAEPPAELRVETLLQLAAARAAALQPFADRLEERLGLRGLGRAFAGELSRGEKRRVLLFGALCAPHPVIVLDEPFSVFDPLQMIEVRAVLRERVAAGASVLLSVHQMTAAEQVASRILLLDGGRRVAFGSLAELRTEVARADASLEDIFVALLRRAHGSPPA